MKYLKNINYWSNIELKKIDNKTVNIIKTTKNDDSQSITTSRRDFIKKIGLGIGMATLSSCTNTPVKKSVSYLFKEDNIISGSAKYYATTLNSGYSVLVKTVDGRPIKIEGNKQCPISQGGVDAITHASLLSLYNDYRIKYPIYNGERISWNEIDNIIKKYLHSLKYTNKKVIFISSDIYSPSTNDVLQKFVSKYPNIKHIVYNPISYSSILISHKNMFDKPIIPNYRFDKANVIVSIEADFLGTWISPVEFSNQYIKNRNIDSIQDHNMMSKHIQIESILSISGSKADIRIPIKPSQIKSFVLLLYKELINNLYNKCYTWDSSIIELSDHVIIHIKEIVKSLISNKQKSIVICGLNDINIQNIINAINWHLDNYNNSICFNDGYNISMQNDNVLNELVEEMNDNKIGAIFFYHSNPCYYGNNNKLFTKALKNVDITISCSNVIDETTKNCNIIIPDSTLFESWHDINFKKNVYSISQPTINPLFDTRQIEVSILKWIDYDDCDFYNYIKNYWKNNIFPLYEISNHVKIEEQWNNLLRKGFTKLSHNYYYNPNINYKIINNSIIDIENMIIFDSKNKIKNKIEIVLYQKVSIKDGEYSNNPLLQELPDPISKVTWDNYASISPYTSYKYKLNQGNIISIHYNNEILELPVIIQPGQANNVIAIALGYGKIEYYNKINNFTGKNAYPFLNLVNSTLQNYNFVMLNKTLKKYEFAQTQIHHDSEQRGIVRENTLDNYIQHIDSNINDEHENHSLWPEHNKSNYQWGMVIDLNACIGCNACIISCNMENNIPVVGKSQIKKKREMHWIRIDRYYTDDVHNNENVSVIHQPMMCQHCNNAPCETVCPVLATLHSAEGLNQQVYNRCFGTRYCANNCPYKVRRFNWFKYHDNDNFNYNMNNDLGKLMLNPDVTVRSRGVMEKCSMCVQRIQAGKLKAKINDSIINDGDIETACSSSCPTNAITFGNKNNPKSKIKKLINNDLNYNVLNELNTKPNISYITMIRNK